MQVYSSNPPELFAPEDQNVPFGVQAHHDLADALRALMEELGTQLKARGRYAGSKLAVMQRYGAALCAPTVHHLCMSLDAPKRVRGTQRKRDQRVTGDAQVRKLPQKPRHEVADGSRSEISQPDARPRPTRSRKKPKRDSDEGYSD